jgi:hypothetical protein
MELGKLKALAEDVKGWSNCDTAWLDPAEDELAAVVGHINEDGEKYCVTTVDCDQYYAAGDSLKLARFYAAANPATVLALLDKIENLDKMATDLQEDSEELTEQLAIAHETEQQLRAAIRKLADEREEEVNALRMVKVGAGTTARPPTPTGWSDTDWIKHLQEQQHPLAGLHINQGSMDAAADAYEAEFNARHNAN